jgi:hypothetical protein
MYASLVFSVATFVGGSNPQPPPPPPPVAVEAPVYGHIDAEPIQATPAVPIHDGRPLELGGQTAADATVIPDDGYGFPVETGPAEIARFGQPRDLSNLAELCGIKPWMCDDSYAH